MSQYKIKYNFMNMLVLHFYNFICIVTNSKIFELVLHFYNFICTFANTEIFELVLHLCFLAIMLKITIKGVINASTLSFILCVMNVLTTWIFSYDRIHFVFYSEFLIFFNILLFKKKVSVSYSYEITRGILYSELFFLVVNHFFFFGCIIEANNPFLCVVYILNKIFTISSLHESYYGTNFKRFIENVKDNFIEVFYIVNNFKKNIIFFFLIMFTVLYINNVYVLIYHYCNLIMHLSVILLIIHKWNTFDFTIFQLPPILPSNLPIAYETRAI